MYVINIFLTVRSLSTWLKGMLVTETIMDHLASAVGMDPFELRSLNMYKVSTRCARYDAMADRPIVLIR